MVYPLNRLRDNQDTRPGYISELLQHKGVQLMVNAFIIDHAASNGHGIR